MPTQRHLYDGAYCNTMEPHRVPSTSPLKLENNLVLDLYSMHLRTKKALHQKGTITRSCNILVLEERTHTPHDTYMTCTCSAFKEIQGVACVVANYRRQVAPE